MSFRMSKVRMWGTGVFCQRDKVLLLRSVRQGGPESIEKAVNNEGYPLPQAAGFEPDPSDRSRHGLFAR